MELSSNKKSEEIKRKVDSLLIKMQSKRTIDQNFYEEFVSNVIQIFKAFIEYIENRLINNYNETNDWVNSQKKIQVLDYLLQSINSLELDLNQSKLEE
jgi:hypothetical protein